MKRYVDLNQIYKECAVLTLSLKEKYDVIYSYEEQFAYRLGKNIINKPEISVWMILLPVLFVHHMYKVNQYKAGIKSFAQGILDPKEKALSKAYNDVSAGKKRVYEVKDYFPDIDLSAEKQTKLAEKQVTVIKVMEKHYFNLLKNSGRNFEELFRKTYPTQGDYRLYLKRMEKSEDDLYDYLNRKVHKDDASRKVIKDIREFSQKMHEDELRHFF